MYWPNIIVKYGFCFAARLPAVRLVIAQSGKPLLPAYDVFWPVDTPTDQPRGGYSLYEVYYICSAISTPLFQASGKYLSKNEENIVDYGPIVSHFATHAIWLVCIDILKIVNRNCTVIIHYNSSLPSGSRYCKPEVISWWKVNITVFYTRFHSPTDQKCAESSAFLQFYYCPPSIQRERYGFSISVQPEITSLLRVFFNVEKKCFPKVGRSVIIWRSG